MLTLDIEHGGRIYEVTGDGWELTGPGLDDLSIADQDAVGRKFDRLRLELQPVEATPGAASYEGWKQNRVERERLILMPA